jgi:hypothetical protein
MTIKKKIIVVPVGAVPRIATAFGVTRQMVYNALAYNSNSETAMKIRKDAIDLYGGTHSHRIVWN